MGAFGIILAQLFDRIGDCRLLFFVGLSVAKEIFGVWATASEWRIQTNRRQRGPQHAERRECWERATRDLDRARRRHAWEHAKAKAGSSA